MTLKQIASLGRELVLFLRLFAGCFGRQEPRELLQAYVQGQLSSIKRKSVEPMVIEAGIPPRTLQRLLESIQWDEEKLRDRCQQIVATEHADPRAIGIVDESGVPKSGQDTVGVDRQWCGRTGKVDNCVVSVHTSYASEDFLCLLDSTVYLTESWAFDADWRSKAYVPEEVEFRTKPQIAEEQIERALNHGIQVAAWTFDALYGRDSKFLTASHFLEIPLANAQRSGQPFIGQTDTCRVIRRKTERLSGLRFSRGNTAFSAPDASQTNAFRESACPTLNKPHLAPGKW